MGFFSSLLVNLIRSGLILGYVAFALSLFVLPSYPHHSCWFIGRNIDSTSQALPDLISGTQASNIGLFKSHPCHLFRSPSILDPWSLLWTPQRAVVCSIWPFGLCGIVDCLFVSLAYLQVLIQYIWLIFHAPHLVIAYCVSCSLLVAYFIQTLIFKS